MLFAARTFWSILLVIFLCACYSAYAADPGPSESDLTTTSFPALTLESQIFSFPDEDFVRIALKIQLGTASIQERRAWYRASERYAPFQAAPLSNWKMNAYNAASKINSTTIYNWSSIGPNGNYDVSSQWGGPGAQTQGRATALWTHLNGSTLVNKKIIFLGTADGGVWKSVDGGDHWTSLFDQQPSMAIGAIDVLPQTDTVNYNDAIVYVGTGEGNFSQPDKDGVGVLKSTNGGQTWAVEKLPWRTDATGFAGLHHIRRLRIDRNIPNAQSVWVAGDGGIYHTANGGTTWSLITGLPYTSAPSSAAYPGGCWNEYPSDFLVNTTALVNGNSTLIAAFGNIRDNTCTSTASDSRKNNGIYRSTDGGNTWQKISVSGSNGFPAIPGNIGRMSLIMAPSNPKHIYVQIAKADDFTSLGLWSTLDSTATPVQWIAGSTTEYTNGQGWYDLTGSADPTNENKFIVGGLDNYLSTDGGTTLTKISGWSASDNTWAHADHHHAIYVDANTYYDANDGGLNVGTINGTSVTWTHKNVDTLSTLQFYGLGQSATNAYKINAGLQDNGHALLNGALWHASYGGDGGFAAVDQSNENEAYEEYVYAAIRNSDDGGNTWPTTGCMQNFGTPPCSTCQLGTVCVPDSHTAFIANFMLDVHNQNIMYVGSNYLYRNMDASNASKVWTRITTDGLNGDFVKGASSSRAYISIVHTPQSSPVSGNPALSQILYVGTSTGRIWKSTDAGQTWTDLTKAPLPVNSTTTGRFLTWIDTDPADANRIVLTYSGWSNSTVPSMAGHVFRSTDGGSSWVDISGALPDEPFNTVAVNPNSGATNEIYVGSDSGVYLNQQGWSGNSWIRINSGLLPNVSVNMLQFTSATNPKRLRAATHGRGIWELFKDCSASVTVDKPAYTCSDSVTITVQDQMQKATTQTVIVSSSAERNGESVTLAETPAGSGHYVGKIQLTGAAAKSGDGKLSVLNADQITVKYNDKSPCGGTSRTIQTTATTNCSTCGSGGSTASGANLELINSPTVNILSGDGDSFIDNCESVQIGFPAHNIGKGNLTNVRITAIVPSNPGVKGPAVPLVVAPSLAQCGTAPINFTVKAGGLKPNEKLTMRVDVTSDELVAMGITRSINLQLGATEQDFKFQSSKTFGFDTDMEGWQVIRGTFNRTSSGGGAQLTQFYLASSSLTDGACDEVRSPVIQLTSTSTLSLYNQFATEPMSDAWYDRANVGIVDVLTGTRTNIAPSGGRTYLASGPNGTCVTGGQPGWAGPGPGWLQSTWSSSDLLASQFAGKNVQLDVGYGTDPNVSGIGFWLDQVTLTNFELQTADTSSDVCTP